MNSGALVITTRPGTSALTDAHVAFVEQAAGRPGGVHWLAPGDAFEVQCERMPAPDFPESFGKAFGASADCNFVTLEGQRKKLLVADMESTIIEQECLDELASCVGLHDKVANITKRAMAGEIDFEAALRERVQLLRGMSVERLEDLYNSGITLMPGAKTLIATMSAHGAHCALVSGGFTWFTERIAEKLGFQSHQGNELIIGNGRLTGEIGDPVLGRAAKRAALERLCNELNITTRDAIAVGDGANDLDMLQYAGLGVACHARPAVAETAPQRIDHGDLTALLYLQGYERTEFVNAD